MMMDSNKKGGNDVNGATFRRGGGSASGRGGDNRATQVVNQRKPCSRRKERLFHSREELEVLRREVGRVRWSVIGLCEVRWPGEGETNKDGYKIIYSGRQDGG